MTIQHLMETRTRISDPVWYEFEGVDARWARLLLQAEREGCHTVGGFDHSDNRTGVVDIECRVTSGTAEDVVYRARYYADADGVRLACTCRAGFHAIPCKHLGITLYLMHEFPEPKRARRVAGGTVNGTAALRLLRDEG